MARYTATINREVTTISRREVVTIEAENDDEANKKLRDMPTSGHIADINIVPWTTLKHDFSAAAFDPPAVDGVARQWVRDDDRIVMTLYRSDLQGEQFLNEVLDQEVWEDLVRNMEGHGSLMDLAYAHLHDEWDIGPGRPPD